MNINARFLCRRYVGGHADYAEHVERIHAGDWTAECHCPQTVECEWRGDERGATVVDAMLIRRLAGTEKGGSPIGRTLDYGGVRLKVVDIHATPDGAYCDAYIVMLAHNPHADLKTLYRRFARRVLRHVVTTEARVRGFMLQPVEGREMPFANRLADRLL
jgi:hypothetical protein